MIPPQKSLVAIAFVCAAAYFCAASVGACGKLLSQQISLPTILFFQNSVCLLLTMPRLFQKGRSALKTEKIGLHLARDLAGILSFFCFFYALQTIPLVNGILLQSTGPLWLPWIAFLWLRIKMRGDLWRGILTGFAGILLILKPGLQPLSLGILSALVSGIFSGFTLIAVNRLAATEPTYRILFYYFAVGSLLTGPFALSHFSIPSWEDFLCLLGVGVFTFAAQTLSVYSLRHAKAEILAPIAYTVVVYSGFFDWVIWNNLPDLLTLLGIVLVIAGAISSIYFEKKFQRKLSQM